MKKVCKKRIFVIFSIIMVSFVMLSFFAGNVNAEINPDTSLIATDDAKAFSEVCGKLLGTLNSVIGAVGTFLGSLAIILYLVVALIFSSSTGQIFPAPDNIIFNRMSMLDVNFFNPNQDSIIDKADNVVQKLYNSFDTIAFSIFIIAAMLVGIKMAFSAVASEKAQAKKSLINWLIGIILLFLMRLIIATIFEANEYIVWKISESSLSISFSVDVIEFIPIVGSGISDFISDIASIFTGSKTAVLSVPVNGYTGLLFKFAVAAWGGDIFSAILLFVLFGQTITIFVSYAKRLMYCIILGICAPLVVAVDTINKSLKGQSTILSNWFKEFTGIVFIQIFHSLLLVVTMNAISGLENTGNSAFIGIAAIVLTSGIVKFERLYKQIFGISDGMLGGLKGQAGKVMQTIGGLKAAGGAIGDNVKKTKAAYRSRKEAFAAKDKAIQNLGRAKFERSTETFLSAVSTIRDPEELKSFIGRARNDFNDAVASGWGSREGEREKMERYKILLDKAERGEFITNGPVVQNHAAQQPNIIDPQNLNGGTQQSSVVNSQNVNVGNQQSGVVNSQNVNEGNQQTAISNAELRDASRELTKEISKLVREIANSSRKNDAVEVAAKNVEEADKRIRQANKDLTSGALATAMTPVNVGAGIGFGLGAGEDMAGSALKGGILTAELDNMTEKLGSKLGEKAGDTVYSEISKAIRRFDKHSNVGDI